MSQSGRSQAKNTGLVAIAILCSRVLGLVRVVVFAKLFGADANTSAFNIAFRTPNMLRDLFAEGALSTAFVTTFSKKIKSEGEEAAWLLASKMATLVAVFMSGVVVLGMVCAPLLVKLVAPFWEDAEIIGLTVVLARIMYPFIALVSLAALVMGMLNAHGRFFIPALASSFFNLATIIGGTFLAWRMDPTFGPRALQGFAWGTVIGGACQLLVQLPALRGTGYRFRPDFRWKDSGVRKVLSLMWPAVIAGSAVQVNVLINSVFASSLDELASVTWLENAFRLMQLPLGVFGVAVGMVTLPAASQAATEGITPEFGRLVSRGLRLVFLLTLPSAVGLMLLAEPVISLIFERGKFDSNDTAMVAVALRFYAIGLLFYSGIKVIQPTFYAIDRRFVPMFVSFGSIALSVALNFLFLFGLDFQKATDGHAYLALSTSLAAAANFGALFIAMQLFGGGLEVKKTGVVLLKLVFATAAMAAVCWGAQQTILAGWESFSFIRKLATLLPTIAVAGGIYFGVTLLLKVGETRDFVGAVRRKMG